MNFFHRRYVGQFELTESILINLWLLRQPLSNPSTNSWEKAIRKDKKIPSHQYFTQVYQLLARMWRGNRDYILCLRIFVPGRSETVVLWHTERSACSWTSSALWFRHFERWRRDKRWYWDVSWRNASTAWRTISIFCKILSFLYFLNNSSQVSFGSRHWPSVPEYVDELLESLIAKKAPFVRLHLSVLSSMNYDSCLLLNQIFSYAPPNATISEHLAERIQSSGLGMKTKWSPQHYILNHPVLHPNFYLARLIT